MHLLKFKRLGFFLKRHIVCQCAIPPKRQNGAGGGSTNTTGYNYIKFQTIGQSPVIYFTYCVDLDFVIQMYYIYDKDHNNTAYLG